MKKLTIFLLFVASIFAAFSQEYVKFFYNGEEVNDTIVAVPDNLEDVNEFTVEIQNVWTDSLFLTVTKEVLASAGESMNTFCLGSCYDPSVMVSPRTLDLAPNEISGSEDFHLVYYPLGVEGVTIVKYTLTDNLVSDQILGTFIVKFDTRPEGINDEPLHINKFSAYPNPATSQVTVQYDLSNRSANDNTKIVITNLVGKRVCVLPVSNTIGKKSIDVSNFVAGIYFYSLEINGQATATKKLIVK